MRALKIGASAILPSARFWLPLLLLALASVKRSSAKSHGSKFRRGGPSARGGIQSSASGTSAEEEPSEQKRHTEQPVEGRPRHSKRIQARPPSRPADCRYRLTDTERRMPLKFLYFVSSVAVILLLGGRNRPERECHRTLWSPFAT